MASDVKLKTLTMLVTNNDHKKIFDHMTAISKNIYNCTIYCTTIFYEYKQQIFKEIFKTININDFDLTDNEKNIIRIISQKQFYSLYGAKYDYYSIMKPIANANNKIIYQFIKNILKTINLINNNYEIIREIVIHNILKDKNIIYNDTNKYDVTIKLIDNILEAIYIKNFYTTKNQIMNHKRVTIQDKIFIKQVKNEEFIIKKKKRINWKKKVTDRIGDNGFTDQNLIQSITKDNLHQNKDLLPGQMIIDIIQKAYNGYISFFRLKETGIKANTPKYLPKNGHYNLPFFKNCMVIKDNDVRLTVGKNISENYIDITKNKDMICLNSNANTDFKEYISRYKLRKKVKEKMSKKNNYIIHNKYINKDNKYIIDAYYLHIKIPDKLKDKDVRYIEVVPLYENHSYKICITYGILNDAILSENPDEIPFKDSISIDLGMGNLMSIYDPNGSQRIISGKYLLWLNKTYNNKIDKLKSQCIKYNNCYTTKKIRNLLIERDNKITYHFNLIVKWLLTNYKHKKLVIIGYNKNWKNKVNMGSFTNRTFYGIPYSKLLYKLQDIMRDNGIMCELNEEAHTSKCDALSLEDICHHDNYLGKRINRGLFSSSVHKLLNADINGAINIMRKYYLRFGVIMEEVTGTKLYNPVKVNSLSEVA